MSIAPGPAPTVSLSATTPRVPTAARAPTSEDDSYKLKGGREIVLAAVQHDGFALKLASKELKADRGVVLAAVQNHGGALRYASEELKADPFVKALARRDVKFTCEYLKNLGRLRPTVASEFEALADKIVEIAKYFPELEQEAQDASAQVHNPRNDNGTYSCAHKRDRNEFETEFNCE